MDVIIVGHILIPALDTTQSKYFDGDIITDDLTMSAVVNQYSVGEASVRSFLAGSDIFLNVFHALKSAVISGEIFEEHLNESVKRILMIKNKFSVTDETQVFVG